MEVEYRMTDKVTGELRTTGTSSHCFLNRFRETDFVETVLSGD